MSNIMTPYTFQENLLFLGFVLVCASWFFPTELGKFVVGGGFGMVVTACVYEALS